ncbi:MAG: hypothetical protein P1V81_09405 [Planctomycetota bacterium]|nr:hypothetical protein [Planctomycetota bacterium]
MRSEPSAVAFGPLVLKFGGSVLCGESDLAWVAEAVAAEEARCPGPGGTVVVVSAFGATTDALFARAAELHPGAEARVAELASTGEEGAAALFDMALVAAGRRPVLVPGAELGILTEGPLLDADPVAFDPTAIATGLAQSGLVVVPGFVARDRQARPSLLGRGGSDLTALLLAHHLGARGCVLLKDVDGIHRHDPKVAPGSPSAGAPSQRLEHLALADLAPFAGQVLQPKAAAFAAAVGRGFTLGRPDAPERRTQVG